MFFVKMMMVQRCSFKYFLLLVFICLELCGFVFANGSNFSGAYLSSDGIVESKPKGNDLELTKGTGFINLTLKFDQLQFEVCKDKCGSGTTSKICYEFENGYRNPLAVGSCSGLSKLSSCELKAESKDGAINFNERTVYDRDFTKSCLLAKMKFDFAEVSLPSSDFSSCKPKIDRGNGTYMVKLWVYIDEHCPITVKNAALYVPPTTSTPLPSKSATVPSKKEDSSEASLPWWAIFIIVFVGVLAFIGVGVTAYCIYKKHQRAKQITPPPPAPADPTPVTAVPSDVAAESVPTVLETSAKRRGNLNFNKFQPSLERPKKDKKKKETEEQPSTSEEEEVPPTQLYPPSVNPKGEAFMRRRIPQGLKSVKTDSLDQTTKKDKGEMAEAIQVSTERNCLKSDNSAVLAQMKENYPEVQHRVMKVEIDLLCGRVSEMYQGLNTIATAAEQTLASVRCKFDQYHRLHSVTADGRRLLQDKDTAASTVYFAFGAEYHQFILEDPALLKKASVPLLMVIALQPRFTEMFRRKACAIMRRKLYRILGYYKAADRTTMPFPINILESAYCRDSKYFYHLSEIQTDSEDKKKEAAQKKKQENVEVKHGGKKQRKKQSKKH